MTSSSTVRIGVVGLGYWGPNLARNFAALPNAEVVWICDASEAALAKHGATHPHAKPTHDIEDLLGDDSLDAIVLATHAPSHADLAIAVLAAGKHCFVEKPLATNVVDAERVAAAVATSKGTLMVGHLLEYHPGFVELKELVDSGKLGELRYVYSQRLNLGKLRTDENALWSLGPHDISVLLSLVNGEPESVQARGESYMHDGIEDVVFGYLRFSQQVAAHIHLSWLDPHKERRFTVVGSERMATFDDMRIEGKLMIYDKGFDQDFRSYGEYIARAGDIWQPTISNEEPLRIECRHFVECILEGATPRTDAANGLRVVRVLEELQNSLDHSRRISAGAENAAAS
ncbi:MAG: Gfo/Idh/MocA family oxidoreductase [Thermoleophilaceae bacterium]|nr:Gfo/Idh/MocA family oxidoreductase [Thermoleophilaceae bacterium]